MKLTRYEVEQIHEQAGIIQHANRWALYRIIKLQEKMRDGTIGIADIDTELGDIALDDLDEIQKNARGIYHKTYHLKKDMNILEGEKKS